MGCARRLPCSAPTYRSSLLTEASTHAVGHRLWLNPLSLLESRLIGLLPLLEVRRELGGDVGLLPMEPQPARRRRSDHHWLSCSSCRERGGGGRMRSRSRP